MAGRPQDPKREFDDWFDGSDDDDAPVPSMPPDEKTDAFSDVSPGASDDEATSVHRMVPDDDAAVLDAPLREPVAPPAPPPAPSLGPSIGITSTPVPLRRLHPGSAAVAPTSPGQARPDPVEPPVVAADPTLEPVVPTAPPDDFGLGFFDEDEAPAAPGFEEDDPMALYRDEFEDVLPPQGRSPWVYVGALGCAGLVFFAVILLGTVSVVRGWSDTPTVAVVEPPAVLPDPVPAELPPIPTEEEPVDEELLATDDGPMDDTDAIAAEPTDAVALAGVTPEPSEQPVPEPAPVVPEPAPAAPAPVVPVAPAPGPVVPKPVPVVPKPVPAVVQPVPVEPVPVAPAPEPGPVAAKKVRLTSDPPGMRVTFDGVGFGRTPMTIEIAEGNHSLELSNGTAAGSFPVSTSTAASVCFSEAGGRIVKGCP